MNPFAFPISELLKRPDPLLKEGSLALLTNHTAFDFAREKYLFQILADIGNLKKIFLPEHGLFAELQDQEPLTATEKYRSLCGDKIEFISLYGDSSESLYFKAKDLDRLDALIVALQDVGSRYYTFAVTISYLFDILSEMNSGIKVFILDIPNPAGRSVEGTILSRQFSSFVGCHGLPHRHGLTIGELSLFLQNQKKNKIQLEVIPFSGKNKQESYFSFHVPPSPNMPAIITAKIYSGQCLLEGTNISEGRGTTRPFEIFGAPYLEAFTAAKSLPSQRGAILRPLLFVPTFHKYAGECCDGWHLHLTGENYHSLAHSLKIIRHIKETWPQDFIFRKGIYEYNSDLSAIEALTGDSILIDYLNGKCNFARVRSVLGDGEKSWIKKAQQYLIYDEQLFQNELLPDDDYC